MTVLSGSMVVEFRKSHVGTTVKFRHQNDKFRKKTVVWIDTLAKNQNTKYLVLTGKQTPLPGL